MNAKKNGRRIQKLINLKNRQLQAELDARMAMQGLYPTYRPDGRRVYVSVPASGDER